MQKKPSSTSKVPRAKVRPVQMKLDTPEGSRLVLATARRVFETHRDVIKALANR